MDDAVFDRLMNDALYFCPVVGLLSGGCVAVWLFATGNGWSERMIGLALGVFSGQVAALIFAALVVFASLLHLWVWMPVAQAFADLKSIWVAMRLPYNRP